MASIVTVAELRSILGVSTSLYNDAYLTDVIDTAESVILPMLVKFASPIDVVALQDNIATYYSSRRKQFSAGQSVVITGCGSPFNGTFTILESSNLDTIIRIAL
jgi:threonine dehydrogenase-like Zn-dependent dehydrogenase